MLHWEDIGDVSQSLFCGLAHSNIQHLELSHIEIDDNFRIDVPTWPMRSLHLELRPIIWTNLERTRSAPTCARLLRLCGPMLESLSWVDASENSHSLNTFTTEDLMSRFPRLQKLKLAFMKFADWSMLDVLAHTRWPSHIRRRQGKVPCFLEFLPATRYRALSRDFCMVFSTRPRRPQSRIPSSEPAVDEIEHPVHIVKSSS